MTPLLPDTPANRAIALLVYDELRHRVANDLDTIAALLSRSRQAIADGVAGAVLDEVLANVDAIALASRAVEPTAIGSVVELDANLPGLVCRVACAGSASGCKCWRRTPPSTPSRTGTA